MSTIKYVKFNEIEPNDFIPILNEEDLREHLVSHSLFDSRNIREWVNEKINCDSMPGCRIRAVYSDDILAGWCGIQKGGAHYEIAIVISKSFWGIGRKVFSDMMNWAKELGHENVFIHFLHTRPDYKFLRKIASNVYETELLGNKFTTYQLAVKKAQQDRD